MTSGNLVEQWSTGLATKGLAILIGLLACLTVPVALAFISSHISAQRFAASEEPPADFPVVGYAIGTNGRRQGDYQYLDWAQLGSEQRLRFRLPEEAGSAAKFASQSGLRRVAKVSFRVLEDGPRGQLIEVIDSDRDFNTVGRYLVVDRSLRPLYYRSWGAAMLVMGFLPGMVFGFEAGRFVYRRLASGCD